MAFYPPPILNNSPPLLSPAPPKNQNKLIVSTVSSSMIIICYFAELIRLLCIDNRNMFMVSVCVVFISAAFLPLASLFISFQTWKTMKTIYIVVFILGLVYYGNAALIMFIFLCFFTDIGWTLFTDAIWVTAIFMTATLVLFLGAYIPQFSLYSSGYSSSSTPIRVPPVVSSYYAPQPVMGVVAPQYPAQPYPNQPYPNQPYPAQPYPPQPYPPAMCQPLDRPAEPSDGEEPAYPNKKK